MFTDLIVSKSVCYWFGTVKTLGLFQACIFKAPFTFSATKNFLETGPMKWTEAATLDSSALPTPATTGIVQQQLLVRSCESSIGSHEILPEATIAAQPW